MLEQLQPFINWLHLHPHLAGLATFFISLAESLAVIGLIIPGSVTMTAIGTLIGAGVLPAGLTILWAMAGAVAGDSASYWLGHHYHEHMRELWPFSRYPQLLQKGETFFKAHGGKSVFLGRFVGPIRPIIPVVAGMMNMAPARFLVANVASAIGWAPAYMLPGILLGAASLRLPPETATKFLAIVVLVILILWCISWLINLIIAKIIKLWEKWLSKTWQYIITTPRLNLIAVALRDSLNPTTYLQLATALLFLFCSAAFSWLAISVKTHGILTNLNTPIFHLFRSLHTPFLDHFMVATTFLADAPVMALTFILFLGWLCLRRQWHTAGYWLLLGLLAFSLPELFKNLIQSPRPSGLLQGPTGWSFPSGHASLSTAIYGFLAFIVARELPRGYRWLSYTPAAAIIGIVLFSRLYLGAHWLTDVVGGALLGLSCALITTLLYRRQALTKLPIISTLLAIIMCNSIAWTWYFSTHYQRALYNYTPYWPETTIAADAWWEQTNADQEVPLYRKNRLGKPVQVLNIEWTGDLLTIQRKLELHNWVIIPKFTILNAINHIAGKNHDQQFPFLRELYDDRSPILVMIKRINQPKGLVVLRLWDAKINLAATTRSPLWVGTVDYYKPWKFTFLKSRKANSDADPQFVPAQEVLKQDIADFETKQINRTVIEELRNQYPTGEDTILLVKPKNCNGKKNCTSTIKNLIQIKKSLI